MILVNGHGQAYRDVLDGQPDIVTVYVTHVMTTITQKARLETGTRDADQHLYSHEEPSIQEFESKRENPTSP